MIEKVESRNLKEKGTRTTTNISRNRNVVNERLITIDTWTQQQKRIAYIQVRQIRRKQWSEPKKKNVIKSERNVKGEIDGKIKHEVETIDWRESKSKRNDRF